MSAHKWVAFTIAAAALGQASAAHAEDTSDIEGILDQNVITTASKAPETTTNAPATSTIITAEDLRRYGVHSLAEALDYLSMGAVTANPLRTVDVGARGVMLPNDQGNHFLLLVNGHAVNDPLYGAARFDRGAGIPLELIDHIEVILGPGSVLYGSNAMLGVINVITKSAKDFDGTHVVTEYEIGRSYRAGVGAGYGFDLFGKPVEVTAMVDYYKQYGPSLFFSPQNFGIDGANARPYRFSRNGPGDGIYGGTASNSYYAQVPSALMRVVTGNFELNLHLTSYKRSIPYLNVQAEPDFDDPYSYELDRAIHLDLKHKAQLSNIAYLTTRVYADGYDYQRFVDSSQATLCLYLSTTTCRDHTAGRARWMGVEAQTTIDWLRDARFVTLGGIDGRILTLAAKEDLQDYDTNAYLASSRNVIQRRSAILGAYVQQTWQAAPWLHLNGGARLDVYEQFSPVMSPRFAVSTTPWSGGTFKVMYAEAFRAPTWNETDSYGSTPGLRQIPAQDLSPERVRSVEASLEEKIGTQRILFGVFRSWWRNLVEDHFLSHAEVVDMQLHNQLPYLAGTDVQQYRNIATIDNYGFNARYDGTVHHGSVQYGISGTAAYARKSLPDGSTIPLAVAPQLFGNAHVSWDMPGLWPTFGLVGQLIGRRIADRAYDYATTKATPPTVNLRVTATGPFPGVKILSYRVSADYAFATEQPYVVGSYHASASNEAYHAPQAAGGPLLAPVDHFRVMVGLQLDLWPMGGT